jgi:hypothetical protein
MGFVLESERSLIQVFEWVTLYHGWVLEFDMILSIEI